MYFSRIRHSTLLKKFFFSLIILKETNYISPFFFSGSIKKSILQLNKAHAKLINYGGIPTKDLKDLPPRLQMYYEKLRLRNINQFKFIGAPLLVAAFFRFGIKTVITAMKPGIIVTVFRDTNSSNDLPTKDSLKKIAFFTILKNLPDYIGKVVISLIFIIIIKKLLSDYFINLAEPVLVKYYMIFAITISSLVFIKYVIEFIIFKYLSLDISILKKLPAKIYKHLEILKMFHNNKHFIKEYFYVNFLIYGFTCLFFIILLTIINHFY